MTHTSSCLTFNQRGSSLSLALSAFRPAVPRPHNDSSFNWIFAAAATTNNSNNDNNNTKRHNENENCNFRQAAVARFHFTLLCPVFAGFSWLFSGYQLSSFFFVPALAFLCNWRSARALARLLFLRNKVYISHIHHFWQLQLIVCNVGQMDGPV